MILKREESGEACSGRMLRMQNAEALSRQRTSEFLMGTSVRRSRARVRVIVADHPRLDMAQNRG